MKRIFQIISVFLIIISLCSCASKPSDISDQHYKYGVKAVEIADQYLDFEISADNACDLFESLVGRTSELPATEHGDKNHVKNYSVETYVYLLSREIERAKYQTSEESYQKISDLRNQIAGNLGMKKKG